MAAAGAKPFLGICIGLQMLFEHGEEGDTPGLGLLPGRVPRFAMTGPHLSLKIPHMGWNEVVQTRAHALWDGIADRSRFYFVHSYFCRPADPALAAGETDYGGAFTSAIARDNIFATQFHPEKSADQGLRLYSNFLHWNP